MLEPERFLLELQGIDGRRIVLEFGSEHHLSGKVSAAAELKVWTRRLTAEEFQSEEYQDIKPYDMQHHPTSAIFRLEPWMHYLLYEGEEPYRPA